jgi:hypothetical protein
VNPLPANALVKPVLDEATFQQLLAAAYTLQAQIAFGSSPATSVRPEPPKLARAADMVAAPPLVIIRALPAKTVRGQTSPSHRLFWRLAAMAATAAVSALLLGASIGRLSPLPAGLTLPSENIQQQVPFRRANHSAAAPSKTGRAPATVFAMERQTMNTTGINPAPVTPKEPSARIASLPPNQDTTVKRHHHSAYESEADVVAPDTIVRYRSPRAVPRVQARK